MSPFRTDCNSIACVIANPDVQQGRSQQVSEGLQPLLAYHGICSCTIHVPFARRQINMAC